LPGVIMKRSGDEKESGASQRQRNVVAGQSANEWRVRAVVGGAGAGEKVVVATSVCGQWQERSRQKVRAAGLV